MLGLRRERAAVAATSPEPARRCFRSAGPRQERFALRAVVARLASWGSDGPVVSGAIGMDGSHTSTNSMLADLAEDGVIEPDFRKRDEEKPGDASAQFPSSSNATTPTAMSCVLAIPGEASAPPRRLVPALGGLSSLARPQMTVASRDARRCGVCSRPGSRPEQAPSRSTATVASLGGATLSPDRIARTAARHPHRLLHRRADAAA